MPVYREDIDNVEGFIYLRRMLNFLRGQELTQAYFESNVREAYFIPEGTPVTLQLLNFQQQKKRIGLVVDEYGDCLLYTSPSPRDQRGSRMPSSA